MSGTSLDGLDLAYCIFTRNGSEWTYQIENSATIHYSESWQLKLKNVETQTAVDIVLAHNDYGCFIGESIKKFISENQLSNIDFISSHGHTIFHQPDKRLTFQIGSGAAIAATTGIKTICDFRTTDVNLKGQGAPLVPIGDQLLFSSYSACLNLGGIANISFKKDSKVIAYDICPVNIITNELAQQIGSDYDKGGEIGKKGVLNEDLLDQLNSLPFYKTTSPKSLGKEWVLSDVFPLLQRSKLSVEDKLRTVYEHIAIQITEKINHHQLQKVLITGGGAYNDYLIELITKKTKAKIVIPDKQTIDFKEALIFAFLGVLRFREEINCLHSVTGAKRDNIGGCIYL